MGADTSTLKALSDRLQALGPETLLDRDQFNRLLAKKEWSSLSLFDLLKENQLQKVYAADLEAVVRARCAASEARREDSGTKQRAERDAVRAAIQENESTLERLRIEEEMLRNRLASSTGKPNEVPPAMLGVLLSSCHDLYFYCFIAPTSLSSQLHTSSNEAYISDKLQVLQAFGPGVRGSRRGARGQTGVPSRADFCRAAALA